MTMRKLPTFASNLKAATVKIKEQLIQVREEHKLISRFLIVCRTSCHGFATFLGEYEFQDLYLLSMASFISQRTRQ